MRSSISLRLAVLTPVILLTWFFTSSLVAQQRRKATDSATEARATETSRQGTPQQFQVSQTKPARYIYRYALQSYAVTPDENGVQVAASVDMTDTVGDKSYVWRLQVFREGEVEPSSDVLYGRQVFSIHPSGKMNPTFTETLQLPEGNHRVLLTLYALPKGFDLSRLDEPGISTQVQVIGGIQEVSVH